MDFKVVVKCFTYNQSAYIEETMNGFCMQKMDLPFICLIVDDASTDGEQKVIDTYLDENFDFTENCAYCKETSYAFIKFARHSHNKNCFFAVLLLKENHYHIWDKKNEYLKEWRANAKYEAWCEGDDCWISPNKLNMQVSYMESHPECVLVHTDMNVKNVVNGNIFYGKWKRQKNLNLLPINFGKRLIPLLLQGKYSVTTLTACVRLDVIRECIEEGLLKADDKLLMGDTTMWMALASKGNFHMINENCACYHVLSESATHSKNFSNVINFYVSCLYMVDVFSKRFNVSEKDKNIAVQKYIFFLLREVYTDKNEFLQELKEKILQNRKLNISNSLLLRTMDGGRLMKKIIIGSIRLQQYLSHQIDFYLAKYFGMA